MTEVLYVSVENANLLSILALNRKRLNVLLTTNGMEF